MDIAVPDHLQHRRQSVLRCFVLVLVLHQLIVRLLLRIRFTFLLVLVGRGRNSKRLCVGSELPLASQTLWIPLVRFPKGLRVRDYLLFVLLE